MAFWTRTNSPSRFGCGMQALGDGDCARSSVEQVGIASGKPLTRSEAVDCDRHEHLGLRPPKRLRAAFPSPCQDRISGYGPSALRASLALRACVSGHRHPPADIRAAANDGAGHRANRCLARISGSHIADRVEFALGDVEAPTARWENQWADGA